MRVSDDATTSGVAEQQTLPPSAISGGLRVSVVHPHEMVRRGLESMMQEKDFATQVTAFEDPGSAEVRMNLPGTDVVICPCDLTPEVMELVAATREQQGKTLALLESGDEQQLAVATEMPADGFLLVDEITAQSLEDSLRRLVGGDMPVPALLSKWMLGRIRSGVPARSVRPFFLTAREQETLQLLAEGYSNKQIARSLQISQHGAKRHVANVLAKLNCPNRTLAVALALREGIVDDPSDEEGP
ncbi:response regulator transcription factor [Streptomyces sp. RKND-216]|uniref:helix-turn-helix transcriptional regulator n=1 Tax=Streptomyces sp. RKND-216 TaxID=2562581 RepID=UPI00109D966E|nr:response regulator transcription factor [Streptomyces sp. RKND-216]THA23570.1 response regulator transcription factor [Streptomyces sp. RKND-216]